MTDRGAAAMEACETNFRRPWRVLVVAALLAVGWWATRFFRPAQSTWYGALQFEMLAVQVGIAALPPVNRWLVGLLERWRRPSASTRCRVALALWIVSTVYLLLSAWQQGRDFFPKMHDEQMHLLHARILARGRLWMPPHPLYRFFETFHVFVTPVYVPQHFPGAPMAYVPGMWLHWPWWVTSAAVCGGVAALLYRVLAEVVDGVAGMVAAFMAIGTLELRYESLMVLSNPVALALGLLVVWAWLRWRRAGRRAGWTAVIGALAGWLAITRPPEAICFAVPVGVAMLVDLLRARESRRVPMTVAMLVVGAAPFLAVQLAFDHGVTGHWLKTPHQYYGDLYYPAVSYGLGQRDNPAPPATDLPQKLHYYYGFITGAAQAYTPRTIVPTWLYTRLPILFQSSLPAPWLLMFLPAGLIALCDSARRAIACVLPIFVAVYAPSVMFSTTYGIAVIPATAMLVVLGTRQIGALFPARLAPRFKVLLVVMLCACSVGMLPQLNPSVTEQYDYPTLKRANELLAGIPGRAVVFFRYRGGQNVHEEPVYNLESAVIDDNRVVRAQDLGPLENVRLYDYYRRTQPDRVFYRFDRATRTLTRIDPRAEYEAAKVAQTRPSGL